MSKIKQHKNKVKFSEGINDDIKHLVEKMLQTNPEDRYTVSEILESKWINIWKKKNGISDDFYHDNESIYDM